MSNLRHKIGEEPNPCDGSKSPTGQYKRRNVISAIIQASTDLLNWEPMQTNILGAGPVPFADERAKQYRLRWYRAVILP